MWISRIRVTGGFLGGLDVSLEPGLNVVVGPRGAGKTTFLELLRHAVGGQHADQSAAAEKARKAFLNAVLATGEVVVDLESDDGGRHLVVDAKGSGQRPDLASSVLVLGQNELEEIASDAPSRVNLLDLRIGGLRSLPDRTAVGTLTEELFAIRTSLRERSEEADKRARLTADRELLVSQEQTLIGNSSAQLSEQRELLKQAESRVLASGQDLERIAIIRQTIARSQALSRQQSEALDEAGERAASLSQPGALRDLIEEARAHSRRADEALDRTQLTINAAEAQSLALNTEAREAASPIREELEKAEAGLGQITAQLRNVDAALLALDENDDALDKLNSRYQQVSRERLALLDHIESSDEQLYLARAEVARTTTAQIANNVVVAVDHLADHEDFKEFLTEALRGSNIRATVIEAIAASTLPRQLLKLVEEGDASSLASITSIGDDRAQKVIDHLDASSILSGLSQISLSDSVDFRLRDGAVDKSVDELSTGQKCAVTLPIVLSERDRTLILDQPEDHLDNAFLVHNIVGGLDRRRSAGAQTIIATHNANIPVLGEADNVVVLRSDGRSGRVDVQGTFDGEPVVDRITQLMEGGREAFARRSAFYSEHGGLL